MPKPNTMCDEVGCTKAWTTKLVQSASFTVSAAVGDTAIEKKVCDPCAQLYVRLKK